MIELLAPTTGLPLQVSPPGDAQLSGTPAPPPKTRTQHPRLPITGDLAELVGEAGERGVPPELALQRLGYSKRAAKRAMKSKALRMVLLRKIEEQGGTNDAFAKVIVDGLKAEYVEVSKQDGWIGEERFYADHPTRLQAFDRGMELKGLTGSRAKQSGAQDERPVLNIQAGAKVQLVFFGKAIDALPD